MVNANKWIRSASLPKSAHADAYRVLSNSRINAAGVKSIQAAVADVAVEERAGLLKSLYSAAVTAPASTPKSAATTVPVDEDGDPVATPVEESPVTLTVNDVLALLTAIQSIEWSEREADTIRGALLATVEVLPMAVPVLA
jgi:hypothetical protein